MMHDFATCRKPAKKRPVANNSVRQNSADKVFSRNSVGMIPVRNTTPPPDRKPMRVAVVAALLTTVTIGALGFSHVVSAVSADLNESIAESTARKEAERALKAQRVSEKQRLADERRTLKKIEQDKAEAERSAGYEFYEDLVGQPWPVPVESEAYRNKSVYVAPGVKEDTTTIPYSLQAALYRDESEALTAQKTLAKLGYRGKIDNVKVKAGGTLYRVTLGPFTGLEKATHVRDRLQEHHYYAQVFRE